MTGSGRQWSDCEKEFVLRSVSAPGGQSVSQSGY